MEPETAYEDTPVSSTNGRRTRLASAARGGWWRRWRLQWWLQRVCQRRRRPTLIPDHFCSDSHIMNLGPLMKSERDTVEEVLALDAALQAHCPVGGWPITEGRSSSAMMASVVEVVCGPPPNIGNVLHSSRTVRSVGFATKSTSWGRIFFQRLHALATPRQQPQGPAHCVCPTLQHT